jgi:hypothetical protein
MANAHFASIKPSILTGTYNFDTATFKGDLIDAADITLNVATHNFYDDVTAGVVGTCTLANPTVTSGTFDTDNGTFSAQTGDVSEQILLWIDTGGASSTDPLVALYDTFASGMPVTPNGGDITLSVNASGWFSI